jgi:hypothetical protein
MSARFHIDSHEVDVYLAQITDAKRANALRVATSAGARAAVPILRAATPVGPTGNLRRSVQAKAIRRQYGIGSVVAPMTRKEKTTKSGKVRAGTGTAAQHRALVEYGTKPHIIAPRSLGGRLAVAGGYARLVHHPGAKPNPYLERAAGSMSAAAGRAFDVRITRYLESGKEPSE